MGKLGDYIERVREIIPYDKNIPVKGISADKCFIEAHITNLNRIKVPFQLVKKNQFAYSPVTSRNGDKLSLAFNNRLDEIQVSVNYIVFQIINRDLLNCFYLDLFFKKTWINKIARYSSAGSVRESLSFRNFSWIPVLVPPLNKQERIVNKYQTISKYIELKKKINELFEKQMIACYHALFDNLTDYTIKNFGELFTIIRGGRPPRGNQEQERKYFCKGGGIPWLQVRDISKNKYKFIDKTSEQLTQEGFRKGRCTMFRGGHVIFRNNGNVDAIRKITISFNSMCADCVFISLKAKDRIGLPLLFYLLQENIESILRKSAASTNIKTVRKGELTMYPIKLPPQPLTDKFNSFCEPIFELQKSNEQIIKKLLRIQKCWVESLD